MEELKYVIEDKTIVELLGVQNFTNKESAILELVKNSFDALATKLDIIFLNDQIVIIDNGIGMNSEDIRNKWMHVGKSEKDYEIFDINNQRRVLAGSKGIGRFALARLGGRVEIYSQKNNQNDKQVYWATNWKSNILEERDKTYEEGTKIIISDLRDKWTRPNIEGLIKYLSRTYNDNLMSIFITYNNMTRVVPKYFAAPKLGYNCTSIISLNYDSIERSLICEIESDEFNKDALKFSADSDLYYYRNVINCRSELSHDKELMILDDELDEVLGTLGDFSAELYFSLKEASTKDVEKFCYKHSILPERYESGIILYRNSFSISSYDGTKDWLGLGKRSRLSPAAASHPTGSWRVRENQLAGKVVIDKKFNSALQDLSNRQGLDENLYYKTFVKIINIGISEFERYRQSIIRKIVRNRDEKTVAPKKIIDKVLNRPATLRDLTEREVKLFISELKEYKRENNNFKKEIRDTEERYKYDVRILNVLATSGLKATAIAHELHNDRNSIAQNCDSIIDAMKEFGIWDFVNDSKRTRYAHSNIPELLEKNKKINAKLVTFMDTILEEVEKSKFIVEEHNIFELLSEMKTVWERDYAWIKIDLDASPEIQHVLPEDVIKVIFDNLILNSIQQNDFKNHLNIKIKVGSLDGQLAFDYFDDGRGLDQKYINNPMKILEVHESTREKGHGLGMWIVNNTVTMSGGQILDIDGKKGFSIKFTLGGKFGG